jgi:hypothetical protein
LVPWLLRAVLIFNLPITQRISGAKALGLALVPNTLILLNIFE